jgi:Tol biopolymer transport system component
VFIVALSTLFTKPPRAQFSVSPLVTNPGEKYCPSLSPNGQQLAFSWNGGSGATFSLYEKVVGSEKILRLTNSPSSADFDPVWSPDGREIAFARIANENTGIYIVSVLGGSERRLRTTAWAKAEPWGFRRLDWAPDGKSIMYSDISFSGGPTALWLLLLDTMQTRRLTSPQYQTGDISPKFSPDGKTVAFVRDKTGGQSIYLIPVNGGIERLVASNVGVKAGLAWTSDGQSLIFGGEWMWRVPVTGGQPERLPFGQGGSQPSVRGDRVAFAQGSEADGIWRKALDSPERSEPTQPLISSTRIDAGAQYSPDGSHIAFQSNRSGSFEIWVCRSDGTDARRLTYLDVAWTGTPRWSPDGRFIVFDSRVKGDADLFVIDAQGGPPKRLTTDPSNEVVPSWSRDGFWIYFASDRSGRWEVWKLPSRGGTATQVTHLGGFAAFESVDGKILYYAKGLDVPGLWKIPTMGGEESQVLEAPASGFWGYWAPVKNGIYYLEMSGTPGINFLNLVSHSKYRVFDLIRPQQEAPGLAVSSDGRFILYTTINGYNGEIVLVQGFK